MEKPPAPSAPLPPRSPFTPLPSRPYNPWAIISVSFAASTVLGSWCFGGLVAVITGHVARHQVKTSGEAGGNLALIGLIVGYLSIALFLLLFAAYMAFIVFIAVFAATHATISPSPTPSP
jgi:hypothetical protein